MIDREEAYIEIGRIEDLVSTLKFATDRHKEICIDLMELDKCVEGAEKLYAYVRASNDEKVMIDCCKIDRDILGRCISGDMIGRCAYKILGKLDSIYELSLETIYGVSRDDINKNKYFISSKDGLCRNTETNEVYSRKNNIETTGTLNKTKENEHDDLPDQLRTDEAKVLLDKVVKNGFCDDKYDWKYTKSLLAYFAQKASDTLKLSNKTMSTGQRCVSWQPFENLFTINGKKVRNLSQASQDIVNKGKPNGYKDIDSLF